MRVRIKFSKQGAVKFVGHLDMMRFFQKAIRRAGIDIAYSTGYSPHQLMSFASPLGVGHLSRAEYLDIEVNSHQGGADMLGRLNGAMVSGVKVLSVKALPDSAKNAMASVAAAAYLLEWREGYAPLADLKARTAAFLDRESIPVLKETKKNTVSMDLRPGIHRLEAGEGALRLLADAGSKGNIKPLLLMQALYEFAGEEFEPLGIQVTREELYTDGGAGGLIPLELVGVEF